MRLPSLAWRLFTSHFVVTLLAIASLEFLAYQLILDFYKQHLSRDIQNRTLVALVEIRRFFVTGEFHRIHELCRELGHQGEMRLTAIISDGTVVGDSHENPATMENHANRPEIRTALDSGAISQSIRFSTTLKKDMLYVAIPVEVDGKRYGVLRGSVPLAWIQDSLRIIQRNVLIAGFFVLCISGLVGWLFSQKITAPLKSMQVVATRFAKGDLQARIGAQSTREMSELANTMNRMAAELDEKIRYIQRRKEEQEAILSSMVEGVLAIDREFRLVSINRAAEQLLQINGITDNQRDVREIIRSPQLKRFILDCFEHHEPLQQEISLGDNNNKIIQVHGAVLRDAEGNEFGNVFVLHDITELRKLENMRKDFVANVSHELRTPVTSIKGFVETLQDGAKNNPEELERFLNIIAKQADRLNAIIQDLLTLSTIERDGEYAPLQMENISVKSLVQGVAEICTSKASSRDIVLKVDCPEDLMVFGNPSMIEQAVLNLLDNAIKYSEDHSVVEIECGFQNGETYIAVKDKGCGIPREHLPRLFERFYRVDKARSRNLGGTGLGLAIVKHIAQAHKGRVSVESEVGKGSTFTIYLPAQPTVFQATT